MSLKNQAIHSFLLEFTTMRNTAMHALLSLARLDCASTVNYFLRRKVIPGDFAQELDKLFLLHSNSFWWTSDTSYFSKTSERAKETSKQAYFFFCLSKIVLLSVSIQVQKWKQCRSNWIYSYTMKYVSLTKPKVSEGDIWDVCWHNSLLHQNNF